MKRRSFLRHLQKEGCFLKGVRDDSWSILPESFFRRADPALRAALTAVRQCPIDSRLRNHRHVIVVSARKRAAIHLLFTSPFNRLANSDSFQPAS
jgi:hypothetical protein